MTNSTVRDNTVTGIFTGGGGIFNEGSLTLNNSTISANIAIDGGGIFNAGTLTLTNSTVSSNRVGGGIFSEQGTLTLTNTTISGNESGGILKREGTLTLTNTIIANNPSGGDCAGAFTSLGFNLDSDGTCRLGSTGDLSNADPLLGPLQDNGGPTFTHALLDGSPAIEAGDNSVLDSPLNLATDQRGAGFPRLQSFNVDMGAYEFSSYTVTKTLDTNDGFCSILDCSLREAIAAANSGGGITFNVTGTIVLTSGELTINKDLTIKGPGSGDLAISGNNASRIFNITGGTVTIVDVTIVGGRRNGGGGIRNGGVLTLTNSTVVANNAVISGEGGGIFNERGAILTLTNSTVSTNGTDFLGKGAGIFNNGTLTLTNSIIRGNRANNAGEGGGIYNNYGGTVTLTNSTIRDNNAGDGGGIFNFGTVTLTNSTIRDNKTDLGGFGGGIYNNYGGTVTLTNSTVSANGTFFAGGGGGIFNSGTVTLTNSTISSNYGGDGGGILNSGTVTLTNSTVRANTALFGGEGGGISSSIYGTVTLTNTIIADNPSGGDCAGAFTSLGFNLDSDGSCGLNTTGDLSNVDPLLGPLQDNGGPTFTHALLPGSPAIEAGDDSVLGPPFDQRGEGFPRLSGMHVDIGAYEVLDGPQTSPILSVTTTLDTNDGVCSYLDCSLREAIAAAESGDTIDFCVTGTIVLTGGHCLSIRT